MANPYLHVLRTPHAVPMVVAGFIGRLPLSMVGLGCVLLVAAETGSYGLGGAVAAVGAVTTAVAGPVLRRLADEHGASGLVVGLPLNADGSEGPQAALTRDWATAIEPDLGLPVTFRDERWTSIAAEAALGRPRRGRSGGPPSPAARNRRRADIDREAARRIVQAELDARAGVAR